MTLGLGTLNRKSSGAKGIVVPALLRRMNAEGEFEAGEAVRIVGLKAVPQYNGSQATLPPFFLHRLPRVPSLSWLAEQRGCAVLCRRGL